MRAITTMRITATVVMYFDVVDDEELDAVCASIHEQLGIVLIGNDWAGTVELSWQPVERPDAR